MKLWKHFSFLEFISALLSHWKKVWCGLQNVLRKNDFLCRLVCGSYRNHVVPTWKVCDAYKMIGRANRIPVAPAHKTAQYLIFVHRPFSNANGTPHFFQSTLFFSLFLSFSPVSLFLYPHFSLFSLPFPPFLSSPFGASTSGVPPPHCYVCGGASYATGVEELGGHATFRDRNSGIWLAACLYIFFSLK